MHPSSPGIQAKIKTTALALMLVTLWLLMHGYHGLTGDGQIYAFQAFARIHPQLTADLYLQNTSQDQFTIFSPLYALIIGNLGLESAARLLLMIFTAWLLTAAWSFVRAIAGRDAAWLAAAFLLIVAGDYGGSGVFRISEQFVTARLPAEALIVTAFACHIRGRKQLGLFLALGALFIHPLIALPGLILLVCMSLPNHISVLGAAAGVLATLAITASVTLQPQAFHGLTVMDAPWLQVVRERSQFLFLPLWSFRDWEVNTQPFICLAFTAIAFPDEQIRKLCLAAALVGASGLAVALIGSIIGPVAILVQGQAWRWVWITVLISLLTLPATILQVWRDEKCGPLCAILLVSGWTLAPIDGTACASLALIFWVMRTNISALAALCLRWLAAALGIAIAIWILTKSWAIFQHQTPPIAHASLDAAQIRGIFGLRFSAAVAVVLVWGWIRTSRNLWVPALLSLLLAAGSICALPTAFKQSRTIASASDINEFSNLVSAIPPTSTVLVVPATDVGAFVWFTLQRPNYLSMDQSAGVVFSRATAIEVERRSEVLLPLMDPNWKIMTGLRNRSGNRHKDETTTRPLTAHSLTQVCADPLLGFVISPKDVGFHPLRHERAGTGKDWYLYDCRKVRSEPPAA
jgi:hypothetical protein